jgi:hypothetical protein
MRRRLVLLAFALALAPALSALGACAGPRAPETSGPSLILSRLYFGTASPQGPVQPADFDAFLDTCVTPRFPSGLTRYAADGQWRGSDGKLVREKSVVVEIIRPDDAENARRVDEIIGRYKARFAQEAVLLVEEKPSIRF